MASVSGVVVSNGPAAAASPFDFGKSFCAGCSSVEGVSVLTSSAIATTASNDFKDFSNILDKRPHHNQIDTLYFLDAISIDSARDSTSLTWNMASDPNEKLIDHPEPSSVALEEPMIAMGNKFVTDSEMRQKGLVNDGNLSARVEEHGNPSGEEDDTSNDVRDHTRGGTYEVDDNSDEPSSYNNVASEREADFTSPGSSLSMPEGFDSNLSSGNNVSSVSSPSTRIENVKEKNEETMSPVKKVFILHFTDKGDSITNDIIYKFGSHLVKLGVDVTLDLFSQDVYTGNWNIWYETELAKSNLVLCLITEGFNDHLTGKVSGHVRGDVAYNLMNSSGHTFIPVFLGSPKNLEHIPTCLQGFSSYSIAYKDISKKVEDSSDDFKAMYSLVTGQNRRKKPERGQTIILPTKDSVQSENESSYVSLQADNTPVKSVRAHNKLFMLLAMNMVAEWEPVGRTLGIGEPKLYSIKRDYPHSVQEQAVQMFHQWLMKNGSRATLGALAKGIYEAGPPYRNLLDVIIKQQKV